MVNREAFTYHMRHVRDLEVAWTRKERVSTSLDDYKVLLPSL